MINTAVFLFGLYQYRMRKRDRKQEKLAELQAQEEFEQGKRQHETRTAEDEYRETLKNELGSIKMLGSPDIENLPVNVNDAFVHLDISETWRSDTRFDPEILARSEEYERHSPPDKTMQRAFQKYRMLLIIGDPGSGKTTLMQYYAMCCLDGESHKRLGFNKPVLPLYFPVRELDHQKSLPENLQVWARAHMHAFDISTEDFSGWLHGSAPLTYAKYQTSKNLRKRGDSSNCIAQAGTRPRNASLPIAWRSW
ncbi:MAG: hypothetical protein ACREOO_21495 [bacterium]